MDEDETMFSLTDRITINVTAPQKVALTLLAARRHISVADIFRGVLFEGIEKTYPEWTEIYQRAKEEESQRFYQQKGPDI